jgi:hypothetical protein
MQARGAPRLRLGQEFKEFEKSKEFKGGRYRGGDYALVLPRSVFSGNLLIDGR